MNNSHQNTALSFERILSFIEAVFAIVTSVFVPGLMAQIMNGRYDLILKFLGFKSSFFTETVA
jgi:hypothetical protein